MSEETATKTRLRVGPAGRRRGDAPRKRGAKLAVSSAGTACRGAKRTVPSVTNPTPSSAETGSCKQIGCSPCPPAFGRTSNHRNREEGPLEAFVRLPAAGDQS